MPNPEASRPALGFRATVIGLTFADGRPADRPIFPITGKDQRTRLGRASCHAARDCISPLNDPWAPGSSARDEPQGGASVRDRVSTPCPSADYFIAVVVAVTFVGTRSWRPSFCGRATSMRGVPYREPFIPANGTPSSFALAGTAAITVTGI